MPTSKIPRSTWQQALKFISKCPLCEEVYDQKRASLFAEQNSAYLVHISCTKCESNFVAMILTMGQGLSSVGMVTDLNLEDVKRLYQAEPITLNEALGGYKIIEKRRFNSLILNGK
jgi:hypothetical protein